MAHDVVASDPRPTDERRSVTPAQADRLLVKASIALIVVLEALWIAGLAAAAITLARHL
jgi:hypothetical protein